MDDGVADAVVDDLAVAAAEADIICTATLAKDPLIRGEWLRPGTHVDCVGAYSARPPRRSTTRSCDGLRIFVDSRLATLAEGGDLVIPIAAGVITAGDVRADLYELSQGSQPGTRACPATTTRSRCSRTAEAAISI